MAQVRVRHTKRNQLHLPVVNVGGQEHKITIGSTSDAGNLDVSVPKPEQVIEKDVWDELKKLKAVKHWLEDGTLIEYRA